MSVKTQSVDVLWCLMFMIVYFLGVDVKKINVFHLKCGCYISEVGNTSSDDQHFPFRGQRR